MKYTIKVLDKKENKMKKIETESLGQAREIASQSVLEDMEFCLISSEYTNMQGKEVKNTEFFYKNREIKKCSESINIYDWTRVMKKRDKARYHIIDKGQKTECVYDCMPLDIGEYVVFVNLNDGEEYKIKKCDYKGVQVVSDSIFILE